MLDDALLRPGRLDRIIYVPLPDEQVHIFSMNHYFGSPHSVFIVLWVLLYVSFIYFLYDTSVLVFQCLLTSIFHVVISTSSSVFLSGCSSISSNLSLTSLIVSLTFATFARISSILMFVILFIPINLFNILISPAELQILSSPAQFPGTDVMLYTMSCPVETFLLSYVLTYLPFYTSKTKQTCAN